MPQATLINLSRIAANEPAVASDMTANLTALRDAANQVDAEQIASGAVTQGKLAASAVVSTKLSDGSVLTTKINDGAVTADKIASDAVTTAKIASAAVTIAKLAAGVGRFADGSYTGNGGSGDNTVDGLGFKPDLVLIARGDRHHVSLGVRADSAGDPATGPIRIIPSDTAAIGAAFQDAIEFNADGFTIPSGKGNDRFNGSGETYYFAALAATT